MSFPNTGTITGAPQTGLTTPAYVLTADTPPGVTGKQGVILSLTGTQTGVTTHSVSDPFYISGFKPAKPKVLQVANAQTGLATNVPFNRYKLRCAKGAQPLVNNPYKVGSCELVISVPAGADSYNPQEIRAMLSAFIGYLWQNSATIGDSVITGTV